jgi:DNA-directed RNA polymerase subunit RPC12/RpoP
VPDENTVKFECLHCSQSIESPDEFVGSIIDCPSCGKKVKVTKKLNIPLAAMTLPKETEANDSDYERIRDTADTFARMGVWFVIGAILLGGFCIAAGSGWARALCVSGAAAGLGAWCYLLAQVIYIRAALEKRD